jgi:hypothetical protein
LLDWALEEAASLHWRLKAAALVGVPVVGVNGWPLAGVTGWFWLTLNDNFSHA